MTITRRCSKCGFPLGVRPGMFERDGVRGACINSESKKGIDWKGRQEYITKLIAENHDGEYDCAVAVSGGKDSHAIVKRLFENHGVKKALLITVCDEFTKTEAGKRNLENLVNRYNCDHIAIRYSPAEFKKHTKEDFINELHPLKWIEERIYSAPINLAKALGIKVIFFGENSAFEYGTSEDPTFYHPYSGDDIKVIYFGMIWPYSIIDSLVEAKEIGFVDLDDTGEWERKGSIEQFTQIDSIGYLVQLWTKYPKYGFQRVTDIACRMLRELKNPGLRGLLSAYMSIEACDHILDPRSKADFCRCIDITEDEFDEIVRNYVARQSH